MANNQNRDNHRTVKAVVRIVLEIESSSRWGSNCTIEQISKQAEDEVRGLLTQGNEHCLKDIPRSIRSIEMAGVKVSLV